MIGKIEMNGSLTGLFRIDAQQQHQSGYVDQIADELVHLSMLPACGERWKDLFYRAKEIIHATGNSENTAFR